MRFEVDFQQCERRRPELRALGAFLNQHLIGRYHGAGLRGIFVEFLASSKAGTPRKRSTRDGYATIQLAAPDAGEELEVFQRGFECVVEAVRIAGEIPLKDPDFRQSELLRDLDELRAHLPSDDAALQALIEACPAIEEANWLELVKLEHRVREENPKPLVRRLVGIRIYPVGPCKVLPLRAGDYAEVYGNLLLRANVLTPRYSEIYIYIAGTIEEALRERAVYPRYECAAAALDVAAFEAAGPAARAQMCASAFASALRSIARIDHLDMGPCGDLGCSDVGRQPGLSVGGLPQGASLELEAVCVVDQAVRTGTEPGCRRQHRAPPFTAARSI